MKTGCFKICLYIFAGLVTIGIALMAIGFALAIIRYFWWLFIIIGVVAITAIVTYLFIKWQFPQWLPIRPIAKSTPASSRENYFRRIKQLDEIKLLAPTAFEDYVGTLFKWMGWTVETTPVTGDKGVDLFLRKEEKSAIVQCKRYEGTVGAPTVRDLYGAMVHNRADEAYLVTTGTISLPAQRWASDKPVHLVDCTTLLEWVGTFERTKEVEVNDSTESHKQKVTVNPYDVVTVVLVALSTLGGLSAVAGALIYVFKH
jgi:restriction system protein